MMDQAIHNKIVSFIRGIEAQCVSEGTWTIPIASAQALVEAIISARWPPLRGKTE